MRYPRFTARLLNRPHLVTPAAARTVLGFLMPGARLDGPGPAWDFEAADFPAPRSYAQAGGVALIPIVGELVNRGSAMDADSGLTSYQAVGDMIGEALDAPDVHALLLDVDSCGGEGAGCLDLAAWIAAQRGGKPIWACVGGQACSAAYALASAADRVVIGEDGIAGSIGVVAMHTDLSQALAREGVRVEFIFAGAKKVDGNQAQPLSDSARSDLQGIVDAMASRFYSVVSANRSIPVDAVAAQQAGIYRGRDAVLAGLADTIGTMEDSAMQLSQITAATGARLRTGRQRGALGAGAQADAATPPTATPGPAAAGVAATLGEMVGRGPLQLGELTQLGDPATDPPAPLAATQQAAPDCPTPGDCACAADGTDCADGHCGKPGRHAKAAAPPVEPAVAPAGAAEPAALAQACADAGLPDLIAPLLRQGATMSEAQRRIGEARGIMEAAQRSGQPGMGRPLVVAGVSLATARELLFAARAEGADSSAISTARPARGGAAPLPDPIAIFRTYNQRRGT